MKNDSLVVVAFLLGVWVLDIKKKKLKTSTLVVEIKNDFVVHFWRVEYSSPEFRSFM